MKTYCSVCGKAFGTEGCEYLKNRSLCRKCFNEYQLNNYTKAKKRAYIDDSKLSKRDWCQVRAFKAFYKKLVPQLASYKISFEQAFTNCIVQTSDKMFARGNEELIQRWINGDY